MILGEYGSGKTTLLNKIQYLFRSRKEFVLIPVDLPLQTKTPLDFIVILISAISGKLDDLSKSKAGTIMSRLLGNSSTRNSASKPDFVKDSSSVLIQREYEALNAFVDLVSEFQKSARKPVFLVDETDKLPELFRDVLVSLRETFWRAEGAICIRRHCRRTGLV